MDARDFIEAVSGTADFYGMDLSRPLVLVSGGPDSVALLRAVLDLGGYPVVLHVNHGLRGEESDADEGFVRSLCESLGIRCEVRRVNFPDGSNFQARARDERYRISEEVSNKLRLSAVATGHNADDVAETVLLNLARGAGLRGLSGIPPTRGNIVRPLIERSRAEILAYLETVGQAHRTDSSNLAPKYSRNRVRLDVMPILEETHPGASRNIARAASLAREDLEALEEISAGAVEERGEEAVVVLGRASRPALLRHAVRRAYASVAPDATPLDSKLVGTLVEASKKSDGTRTFDLPGGVVAAVRFGREISFYRPGDHPGPVEAEEVELAPGEIQFAGWKISVREEIFDAGDARKENVAYVDPSRAPYRVRMVREGDTIRPMGLGGKKKVFRAMMDRGVPKDGRRKTPVVVDARGRVAWVFHGETGEDHKVGTDTKAMRVEVRKA